MAIFWRIWATVMVVTSAVLAIFLGLATLQFDQIHSDLVGERLEVLTDRTVAPFREAVRIGLPLDTVRNASALLERARQTDELISTIHVFDEQGRIVHSTDAAAPPAILPEALMAHRASLGRSWHMETADFLAAGIGLSDDPQAAGGGILAFYPREVNATQVRAVAADMGLAAILVLAATAFVGGIVARVALAGQIREFEAIDLAISMFERDAWRRAAGADLPIRSGENSELPGLLDAADATYRAAGHELVGAQERKGP